MLETYNLFRAAATKSDALVELSPEDIRDIQRVLLELIEDFDQVCRRHGLQYMLVGGSALGAVRHGGFIPWDEDLDVCMPRRDYERLPALFREEFPEKYWVRSIADKNGYDLNFSKICRRGSRYLEIFEPVPEEAGIFMDVYCLENTFNSAPLRALHGVLVDGLLLCTSCVRIWKKRRRLLEFMQDKKAQRLIRIKAALGCVLSLLPLGRWCALLEKCAGMCHDGQSRYITVPAGRKHFWGELYEREIFFPVREIAFEGRRLFVPGQVERYLEMFFGNYREIPPVEKRERHVVVEYALPADAKYIKREEAT